MNCRLSLLACRRHNWLPLISRNVGMLRWQLDINYRTIPRLFGEGGGLKAREHIVTSQRIDAVVVSSIGISTSCSRARIRTRFANVVPCLIGTEAGSGDEPDGSRLASARQTSIGRIGQIGLARLTFN
jgi:hypothetical protein